MFKVTVINPNKQGSPFSAPFPTREEAQNWIDLCSNKPSYPWGKPERQEEVLDENGNSFDPPQFQTLPAEFTIEIEDISAQVEQQNINAESLKYLADTDWYVTRFIETGVEIPSEITLARQAARQNIVR
jgi:hypothetical protein